VRIGSKRTTESEHVAENLCGPPISVWVRRIPFISGIEIVLIQNHRFAYHIQLEPGDGEWTVTTLLFIRRSLRKCYHTVICISW